MKLIQDLGTKAAKPGGHKTRFGIYECPECSINFETRTSDVNSGKSKMCRPCSFLHKQGKHGKANDRLYNIWKSMVYRTTNAKSTYFKKGITLITEWKDVNLFYGWALSNGYTDKLSIDRIDNNGNYEPSNCRWVDKSIQSRNTRILYAHNTSGYRGVHQDKRDQTWIASIVIKNKRTVIGYFKNKLEAAKARDLYVITNDLEHTLNGVLQ